MQNSFEPEFENKFRGPYQDTRNWTIKPKLVKENLSQYLIVKQAHWIFSDKYNNKKESEKE